MTEIGKLEWHTLPPILPKDYFGTIKDWTQTLATKINQAGATLFKNRGIEGNLQSEAIPVIYRKIIVPNSFKKQFEMLEYYYPERKNLAGRFDVEFSDDQEMKVCENNYYVTITLINENYR